MCGKERNMNEYHICTGKQEPEQFINLMPKRNEKGIALLLALIVTLVAFLMVASTLYVITQATRISGPRKVYATACQAADGAAEVLKDAVEKSIAGDPVPDVLSSTFSNSLSTVILNDGASCSTNIAMPGAMGGYSATVKITRMYAAYIVGARIKFPPDPYSNGTAVFFKFDVTVTGPNNKSRCEDSIVYRHV